MAERGYRPHTGLYERGEMDEEEAVRAMHRHLELEDREIDLFLAEAAFGVNVPEGWELLVDESGKALYYCSETKETAWTHPSDPALHSLSAKFEAARKHNCSRLKRLLFPKWKQVAWEAARMREEMERQRIEEERRHSAAQTKISAIWKGIAARREYTKMLNRRFRAIIFIQIRIRGWKKRKFRERLQRKALETKQRKCALKIQSQWRGMRSRWDYLLTRVMMVQLQATIRGFLLRNWLRTAQHKTPQIQRIARGFLTRLFLCRRKASVVLQRMSRAWAVRCDLWRRHRAATQIERIWRGIVGRQDFEDMYPELLERRTFLNRQATLIAATYRGYRGRTRAIFIRDQMMALSWEEASVLPSKHEGEEAPERIPVVSIVNSAAAVEDVFHLGGTTTSSSRISDRRRGSLVKGLKESVSMAKKNMVLNNEVSERPADRRGSIVLPGAGRSGLLLGGLVAETDQTASPAARRKSLASAANNIERMEVVLDIAEMVNVDKLTDKRSTDEIVAALATRQSHAFALAKLSFTSTVQQLMLGELLKDQTTIKTFEGALKQADGRARAKLAVILSQQCVDSPRARRVIARSPAWAVVFRMIRFGTVAEMETAILLLSRVCHHPIVLRQVRAYTDHGDPRPVRTSSVDAAPRPSIHTPRLPSRGLFVAPFSGAQCIVTALKSNFAGWWTEKKVVAGREKLLLQDHNDVSSEMEKFAKVKAILEEKQKQARTGLKEAKRALRLAESVYEAGEKSLLTVRNKVKHSEVLLEKAKLWTERKLELIRRCISLLILVSKGVGSISGIVLEGAGAEVLENILVTAPKGIRNRGIVMVGNACEASKAAQRVVYESSVLEVLVDLLSSPQTDTRLLATTAVFQAILRNDESRQSFRQLGGVRPLLRVLKTPVDELAQPSTVPIVTGSEGEDIPQEITFRYTAHAHAAFILSECCAGEAGAQDLMRRKGGVTALLSLMDVTDEVPISTAAAACLQAIVEGNRRSATKLCKSGGIPVLLKVIDRPHPPYYQSRLFAASCLRFCGELVPRMFQKQMALHGGMQILCDSLSAVAFVAEPVTEELHEYKRKERARKRACGEHVSDSEDEDDGRLGKRVKRRRLSAHSREQLYNSIFYDQSALSAPKRIDKLSPLSRAGSPMMEEAAEELSPIEQALDEIGVHLQSPASALRFHGQGGADVPVVHERCSVPMRFVLKSKEVHLLGDIIGRIASVISVACTYDIENQNQADLVSIPTALLKICRVALLRNGIVPSVLPDPVDPALLGLPSLQKDVAKGDKTLTPVCASVMPTPRGMSGQQTPAGGDSQVVSRRGSATGSPPAQGQAIDPVDLSAALSKLAAGGGGGQLIPVDQDLVERTNAWSVCWHCDEELYDWPMTSAAVVRSLLAMRAVCIDNSKLQETLRFHGALGVMIDISRGCLADSLTLFDDSSPQALSPADRSMLEEFVDPVQSVPPVLFDQGSIPLLQLHIKRPTTEPRPAVLSGRSVEAENPEEVEQRGPMESPRRGSPELRPETAPAPVCASETKEPEPEEAGADPDAARLKEQKIAREMELDSVMFGPSQDPSSGSALDVIPKRVMPPRTEVPASPPKQAISAWFSPKDRGRAMSVDRLSSGVVAEPERKDLPVLGKPPLRPVLPRGKRERPWTAYDDKNLGDIEREPDKGPFDDAENALDLHGKESVVVVSDAAAKRKSVLGDGPVAEDVPACDEAPDSIEELPLALLAAEVIAAVVAGRAGSASVFLKNNGILPLINLCNRSRLMRGRVAGANAISELAALNVDVRDQVRELKGIKPLVKLAIRPSFEAASALRALSFLTFNNIRNMHAVSEIGGIEVLVALAEAGRPAAQHFATVFLATWAVDMNRQHSIAGLGGLSPLLRLLRPPISDELLKTATTGLLPFAETKEPRTLPRSSIPNPTWGRNVQDSPLFDETHDSWKSGAGVETKLPSMLRPQSGSLRSREWALRTLVRLSQGNRAVQNGVRLLGGCLRLTRLLEFNASTGGLNKEDADKTVFWTCEAIATVAWDHAPNQRRFMALGAVQALMDVARTALHEETRRAAGKALACATISDIGERMRQDTTDLYSIHGEDVQPLDLDLETVLQAETVAASEMDGRHRCRPAQWMKGLCITPFASPLRPAREATIGLEESLSGGSDVSETEEDSDAGRPSSASSVDGGGGDCCSDLEDDDVPVERPALRLTIGTLKVAGVGRADHLVKQATDRMLLSTPLSPPVSNPLPDVEDASSESASEEEEEVEKIRHAPESNMMEDSLKAISTLEDREERWNSSQTIKGLLMPEVVASSSAFSATFSRWTEHTMLARKRYTAEALVICPEDERRDTRDLTAEMLRLGSSPRALQSDDGGRLRRPPPVVTAARTDESAGFAEPRYRKADFVLHPLAGPGVGNSFRSGVIVGCMEPQLLPESAERVDPLLPPKKKDSEMMLWEKYVPAEGDLE